MSVISRRTSEPAGMFSENCTLTELPEEVAVPSMLVRVRPSSTVMRVLAWSKVAPSGRLNVIEETSSLSPTVPSQVRRVSIAPMTPVPPSSFGRAVALLVDMASALAGRATRVATRTRAAAIARASACLRRVRLLSPLVKAFSCKCAKVIFAPDWKAGPCGPAVDCVPDVTR